MKIWACVFLLVAAFVAPAAAQTASPTPAPAKVEEQTGAPASLELYFDMGSARIRKEDLKVLDKASRTYVEGKPVVMILTASTDHTGSAEWNLELAHERATAVLRGLVARGIPAAKFQVFDKGESDPPVPTSPGVPELKDRRVEITWK